MNCYDNAVFNFIGQIFGYVLGFFYDIFKNYGLAIIFFTILTRILLFPLTIKQQKQMAAQQRIQPKIAELKEKYGNNQQLLNTEMQKLYEKEGVKMSMGCGSMLIQFPLFIGMYMAVRRPLSNVLRIGKDAVDSLCGMFGIDSKADYYAEVNLLSKIRDLAENAAVSGSDAITTTTDLVTSGSNLGANIASGTDIAAVTNILGENADAVLQMSERFNFLGFDLLQIASFKPFNSAMILAILVFVAQVASMYISNLINKVQAPAQGCSPNVMAIGMGAFSFWISFSIPAAFPLYWLTSSLLSPVQTWITKKYYGPIPMNAKAEAARNAMLIEDEGKIIEKIKAKKGDRKLKPVEPSSENRLGGGIQGGSESNRSGANKKKKKK